MLLENSSVPRAREQVSAAERVSEWSKQCGASKQVSGTSEWASGRGQLLVHNISNSEMDAMCTALLSRWRANIQICTYSPEHKSSPIHKFHCCMSAQARAQKKLSLSYYAPAPGQPKSQTNTLGLPSSVKERKKGRKKEWRRIRMKERKKERVKKKLSRIIQTMEAFSPPHFDVHGWGNGVNGVNDSITWQFTL